MTKSIIEFLASQEIELLNITNIEPKELGSRKKIIIIDALNPTSDNYSVFYIKLASRFLRKNAADLEELNTKLSTYTNKTYKQSILIIDAPLCSKAKAQLEESNWSVFNESV